MTVRKGDPKKLLVIGAGISGLAGAHWARQAGWAVEILEANAIPGGRAARFEHEGDYVSVGAQYFHVCYRDTRDLLADMGYADKHQPMLRRTMTLHADGVLKTASRLGLRELLGVRGRLSAAYFGARYLAPARGFPAHELQADVPAMDDRLASEAVAHLDRRFVDHVIFPASYGLAQSYPDHTSLLHLARLMVMQTKEFQIPGGTFSLIRSLAERLPVEYETPARGLVVEHGRVVGAELEDDSVRRADHVLVAVPGAAAARLIPDELPEIKENLDRTASSPVIAPAFFLDRKLEGDYGIYTDMDPGRDFCVALDQRAVSASGRSALVLLSAYPKTEQLMQESDEVIVKKGLAQLERVVPRFRSGWVRHARVKRHAIGAPSYLPGQYKRNWALQCLVENQPGMSITDARGAHMEASVRRARVAVERMQAE